jgi:hypothetical protein
LGFSEGTDNHYNSARSWLSWTDDAFVYMVMAYVSGELYYRITSVTIGAESVAASTCRRNLSLYRKWCFSLVYDEERPYTASGYHKYLILAAAMKHLAFITILIKSYSYISPNQIILLSASS